MRQQTPTFIEELNGKAPIDSAVLAIAQSQGRSINSALNSGLFFAPALSLSLAAVLDVVAQYAPPWRSWFTEQSLFGLLFSLNHGQPLPRNLYVVDTRGQFLGQKDFSYSHIVARHFTFPVRHLMYRRGYRKLEQTRRNTLYDA